MWGLILHVVFKGLLTWTIKYRQIVSIQMGQFPRKWVFIHMPTHVYAYIYMCGTVHEKMAVAYIK